MKSFVQSAEGHGAFAALTDHTLAGLRLVLSISALFIVFFDPSKPNRLRTVTYAALVTYILYSIALYLLARRHRRFSWKAMQCVTWLDVAWYSALITLGASTNAVFFFFYLFAIIAGSSRGGTRFGVTLTLACTGLFLALNILFVAQLQLDVPRFVRRTVYMAALGLIVAHWGGAEASLRRRLRFLKDLSLIANPRFGIDRTIRQMLRRLLNFYDADYCCFALTASDGSLTFYRLTREDMNVESAPMKVSGISNIPLLNGFDSAIANFVEQESFWRRNPKCSSLDPCTGAVTQLPLEWGMNIAEALGVRSFVTAPLRYRERVRGRVCVGSNERSHFALSDASFLQQAADQILPVIENIRIVDQLASHAAEDERQRIARNVHDRVIQPYLGLHLGLKALQRELVPNQDRAAARGTLAGVSMLDRVLIMAEDGINELRQYVGDLKQASAEDTRLVDSIRRFTQTFEGGTGIRVEIIDDSCGLKMNDRLAAEIFQMTAEALSNVHRHTHSRNAVVRISVADSNLELTIANEVIGELPRPFKPVSIFERADALGAKSEILSSDTTTLVKVEVPL